MRALPEHAKWVETAADWLDTRFRIPFTNIRFGLDFLIGLVPGLGDLISFGISAFLVVAMLRFGVGGRVLLLMFWNILLDFLVGSIPILGDLFDLTYRANRRNLELLRAHYGQAKYRGSIWPVIFLFLALLGLIFLALFYLLTLLWQSLLEGVNTLFQVF